MDWDRQHLAALRAAVEHGTFDAASKALQITPSAFSQRIRGAEQRAGSLLLTRTKPVRPTAAGEVLLQLARQLSLLEAEAQERLSHGGEAVTELPISLNADSLSAWFAPVLSEIADWDRVALRLQIEDQDLSARMLRSGEVMGAVTADPRPAPGCSSQPLGVMRYLPVAHPRLLERHGASPRRAADLARLPMVEYGPDDDLQRSLLRQLGVPPNPVSHRVPTSAEFALAVEAGLGWGVVPEQQVQGPLAAGELVRLGSRRKVDVALYWQRWRLDSPLLERLSAVVLDAAAVLRKP